MAAEEVDLLKHLLEVEREASAMMSDAQKKADEIIAQARAKADSEFYDKYQSIVAETELFESSRRKEIDDEHKKALEEYKSALSANSKNSSSFNSLLEKILTA